MVKVNQLEFIAFAKAGVFILALLWVVFSQIINPNFIQYQSTLWVYLFLAVSLFLQLFLYSANHLTQTFLDPFKKAILDTILIILISHFLPFSSSVLLFIFLLHILISGLVLKVQESVLITLICCGYLTSIYLNMPEVKPFKILLSLSIHHMSLFLTLGLSLYFSNEFIKFENEIISKVIDLKSQEKFLHGIMTHAPSGILTYTKSGEILLKNPLLDILLNLKNSDTINTNKKNIIDLFHDENITQSFLKEDSFNFEFEILSKVFSVNKNIYWDERLGTYVHLAIFQDQTEQRKMENKLRQQEKLAAIGALAAGIAHEIRNPLAGISGSVELLTQNYSNSEDQKLMKIILREIDRLNNLISEFLDYAKPETSPKDVINFSQVVLESIENVKCNNKLNLQIVYDLHIDEDLKLVGVANKLKQALLNLLINAAHAVHANSQPVIRVELAQSADAVVLKISDNGYGMSEETKKKLFEPFHTTKSKGTGLGLAVTHKILNLHKARINVTSEINQGTEFRIEFPRV